MALFLSDALSDEELKRLIERAEKVRPLALEDLPLGELKRWLEQRFVTEAPNILLPRTVDTDQIADSAITADQITAGTITATHIAAGTITANEIAAGTITAIELSASSVTTDKLAANAVTAEKIAAHTITAAEIAAGTITATEIDADTITANEIAADAITTSELAANSVTSAKIASGTIVSGNIASGTITGGNIASGTITAANILANTITAAEIAAGTITADEIAADAITADKIAAGAIDGIVITGSTFRTGSSNPKVIFDSTGIQALNADGDITFNVDGATGKVTALAGIGGPNRALNGSFENPATGGSTGAPPDWAEYYGFPGDTDVSVDDYTTGVLPHGSHAVKLSRISGNDHVGIYQGVPVRNGQTWTRSIWAMVPATQSGSRTLAIYNDYTLDGVYTAHSTSFVVPNDGVWRRYQFTFTIPDTGVIASDVSQFYYWMQSAAAGYEMVIDGAQHEEGALMTAFAPRPDEILPATITDAMVADLGADKITGQLTDAQLAAIAAAKITGQITETQITDDAITTPKIAAGAVTANEIAANTITANEIAANAITTSELDAEAVTAAKIATGTITATQIASGTITATQIAANTIAASNIAADAIGTSELAADAVTADKINVGTLDAISVDAGTITAGTFRGTTFETSSANPKTRMDGTDGFFITDASGNVIVALSDDTSAPKIQIASSTGEVIGDDNSRIAWFNSGHLGSWISGFDDGATISALSLGTFSPDGFDYETGMYIANAASGSTSTVIAAYIGDFASTDHAAVVLRGDNMSSFVKDVWYATGTQLLNGGQTAAISGTEGYDSESAGGGGSYTAPRTGAYLILGWVELQNPNADKRAILTWRNNGVDQGRPLACIFSNVAANSVAAGGFAFATLTAGDVVSAVITNGDTAQRNVAWKLAVIPFGHIA